MAMLSSFEILAETLVPPGVPLPPGAENPLALQGYWVQVSLAPNVSSATFNLVFQETTGFKQGGGQSILNAQIIGPDGEANIYTDFFQSTANGFLYQTVNQGETWIYGVQALPPSASGVAAGIPQGGTGWRGTVSIQGQNPGSLIATPTQRLVYYNGGSITAPLINATVYAVPTFSGGTQI